MIGGRPTAWREGRHRTEVRGTDKYLGRAMFEAEYSSRGMSETQSTPGGRTHSGSREKRLDVKHLFVLFPHSSSVQL